MPRKRCQWQWESGEQCERIATHKATVAAGKKFYYCPQHIRYMEGDPNVTKVERI